MWLLYDGRMLLVRWGNPPLLLRRHHPRRHDDRLRRHGNLLLGRHATGVLLMRHDDRLLGRHRSRLRRHASLRLVWRHAGRRWRHALLHHLLLRKLWFVTKLYSTYNTQVLITGIKFQNVFISVSSSIYLNTTKYIFIRQFALVKNLHLHVLLGSHWLLGSHCPLRGHGSLRGHGAGPYVVGCHDNGLLRLLHRNLLLFTTSFLWKKL